MAASRGEGGFEAWARRLWRWVLVDAPRWLVVAVLAMAVIVVTLVVGLFGPVSVQ